jgi:hypothetical protein
MLTSIMEIAAFLASLLVVTAAFVRYFAGGGGGVQGAIIGLSLVPSFISAATYASFALFSYWLPGRFLPIILPLIVAGVLLALDREREWKPVFAELGRPTWLLILALSVPLTVFAIALVAVATINDQGNHDISVYLFEAADLVRVMTHGTSGALAWASYRHPIAYPHSLAFSTYLSWGFLFESSPGFGHDTFPKLLVGLGHLAVLAAVAGLFARSRPRWWMLAAVCMAILNSVWSYQITAMSRDGFYTGPVISLLALLLRLKDRRSDWPARWWGALGLALWGVLLGHSLGIVLASSVAAGVGLVLLVHYGPRVVTIGQLWLVAGAIVAAAGSSIVTYFSGDVGARGFAFPYYVDPFQHAVFAQKQAFLAVPSIWKLVSYLASTNGIGLLLGVLLAAGALLIVYTLVAERRPLFSATWCALLTTLAASLLLIAFMPVKLEGISLRGAYVSNLRYGFPVGIVALALIAETVRLGLCRLPVSVGSFQSRNGVLALVALIVGSTAAWHAAHYVPTSNGRLAVDEHELCARLTRSGVRTFFFDNDSAIYRCSANAVYAFSPNGARIMGAENDQAIAAELDSQQVDAVVLEYQIPVWWSGTRLYGYLTRTWKRTDQPVWPVVFVRG